VQGSLLPGRGALPERAGGLPAIDLLQSYVFEIVVLLNGIELLVWLTDVLERMISGQTKTHEVQQLLPWAWKAKRLSATVDA
jgi:hypothetical protein